MKTKLEEYDLWYDGSISVDPSIIEKFIFNPKINKKTLFATSINKEIEDFNKYSTSKILVKEICEVPDIEWILPDEYKNLDIDTYYENILFDRIKKDELYEKRIDRFLTEIEIFKKVNFAPIIRTIIYIIDTFEKTNTVYGVGRGSSCSSCILYLVGLHLVDVVKYDIDITDFIKEF